MEFSSLQVFKRRSLAYRPSLHVLPFAITKVDVSIVHSAHSLGPHTAACLVTENSSKTTKIEQKATRQQERKDIGVVRRLSITFPRFDSTVLLDLQARKPPRRSKASRRLMIRLSLLALLLSSWTGVTAHGALKPCLEAISIFVRFFVLPVMVHTHILLA
jgi:hypothetical protein